MRRIVFLSILALALRCAAPPDPAPVSAPEAEPVVAAPAGPAPVIGSVRVTASALNVRREPSTDAEVLVQVKKGQTLDLIVAEESWSKVRLSGGDEGWVASRFVSALGKKSATKSKAKKGCPADSDFAFLETPMLSFSDSSAHGVVIVEANVNVKGIVTGTKVISDTTGDESLRFLAEREIKAATFAPPIRQCVPRAFIFTYRRSF